MPFARAYKNTMNHPKINTEKLYKNCRIYHVTLTNNNKTTKSTY